MGLLAFFLGIIILFFTLSRGPWIAAILAILLVTGLMLYKYKVKVILTGSKSLALIFLIILVTLSCIGLSNDSTTAYWKNRVVSATSMEHRLHIWSIGLQAFKEKPFIGWGLEGFKIAFNKHYTPYSKNINVPFQETHVDKAHNVYVDVAVTGGAMALIIYILLIFGSLAVNLKYIINLLTKDSSDKLWLAIGFAGSILAYMAYAMSAFHIVINVLWLLLALAWTNNLNLKPAIPLPSNNACVRIVPFIVVIITLIFSYYSIITPVLAVNATNRGLIEAHQGKIEESVDSLKQALSYNSFVSNAIRAQSAVLAINSPVGDQGSAIDIFYTHIAETTDDSFITEPYNSYYHLLYGMYYGKLSEVNPDMLEKAEYHFQRSAQLAPGNGEAYFQWGKMHFNLGNMTKAKIKLERALLLIPNNKDVYAFAGSFYVLTGDVDRGITYLQKAVDLKHVFDPIDINALLNSIEESEERQKLEQFYQNITEK